VPSDGTAEPAHRGAGAAVERGRTGAGTRTGGAPGGESGEPGPPATRGEATGQREPAGRLLGLVLSGSSQGFMQ
jgi:hypothetical protein